MRVEECLVLIGFLLLCTCCFILLLEQAEDMHLVLRAEFGKICQSLIPVGIHSIDLDQPPQKSRTTAHTSFVLKEYLI